MVILAKILKCFLMCNYMCVEEYFEGDKLKVFLFMVKTILDAPLKSGEGALKMSASWQEVLDAESTPEWKLKRVCSNIVAKFMFHIKLDKRDGKERIKQEFIQNYSLGFLQSCIGYLKNAVQDVYVSPKCLANCLRSFQNGLQNDFIFEKFNVHLESLILDICIPLLALNAKDQEYWQEDPQQFVYASKSLVDDHNIVKNASQNLIELLVNCTAPDNQGYAYKLINFLAFYFKNKTNPRDKSPLDPLKTEYLLRALEISFQTISYEQEICSKLEELFRGIVIPNLDSEHDVVKSRACSVIAMYGSLEMTDKSIYQEIIPKICACTTNKNLPVKINAVLALNSLMEYPEVKSMMASELSTVLKTILELMNEIDLNYLVNALKGIVSEFSTEIGPYAVDLVKSLAQSFVKYKQNAYKNAKEHTGSVLLMDEDSSESNLAAEMCLDAINNILRADLKDEVYFSVGKTIMELFDMSLLSDSATCLEKSLSFVNIIVHKTNSALEDELMFYFPILCYLATGFPHANEINSLVGKIPDKNVELLRKLPPKQYPIFNQAYLLSPILNFLQTCSQTNQFLEASDLFGTSFTDLLFQTIQCLGDNAFQSNNNIDLFLSIRLIMGFLENFRGQIDNLLPGILAILTEVLRTERAPHLKSTLVGAFSIAILYDPKLFIQYWDQKGHEAKVQFFSWYQTEVANLESDIDRERALYGLAALLSLGNEQALNGINGNKLVCESINLSTYLNNLKKEALQAEQQAQEEEEDEFGNDMEDPTVKEDGLYADYDPAEDAALFAEADDFNPDDFADDVYDDDYSVEHEVSLVLYFFTF